MIAATVPPLGTEIVNDVSVFFPVSTVTPMSGGDTTMLNCEGETCKLTTIVNVFPGANSVIDPL